jgi:hypothetical protein
LRLIIWGVLFLAPIWFYMTYLNASVQQLLTTMNAMQTSGMQAADQIKAFQNSLRNVESKMMPGFLKAPATTTAEEQ